MVGIVLSDAYQLVGQHRREQSHVTHREPYRRPFKGGEGVPVDGIDRQGCEVPVVAFNDDLEDLDAELDLDTDNETDNETDNHVYNDDDQESSQS